MTALNYDLQKLDIVSVDNKEFNIIDLMMEMSIYESILSPFMTASLVLVDSGSNVIGNLPIQGNETIKIELKTADRDTTYNFDFKVYSINNRMVNGKIQAYELKLVSYEALANEALRIGKKYEDYGHKIVYDIMKQIIKTKKTINADDPCQFKMKFIPSNKRPFELIYSLATKCVPKSSGNPTATKPPTISLNASASSTPSTVGTNAGKLKGTAGYLFFETYNGYVFKSIDKLASGNAIATYSYSITNTDKEETNTSLKILEYSYDQELDIFKRMRMGTYSSLIIFFNPSTGTYEEYVYSLNDTYKNMTHMGSAEKLPKGQRELAQYPTRIMAQFIDHETFYNDTGTASPETKDTSGSPTQFPDWKKYYLAQSIGRMSLLSNQVLNITIPCSLQIHAGDKLNLLLPNVTSEKERSDQTYDEEHSGVYLIQDISYNFKRGNRQAVSGVKLVRDSYGMKDKPSKVK